MTIPLASTLPSRSSDLPGNSGGPPSSVPLFGLAPGGVYLAPAVTGGTGELLPHRFTLTPADMHKIGGGGFFLWHFPSCHQDWALPSTLSYGARTFLPRAQRQGGGHLSYSNIPVLMFLFISRTDEIMIQPFSRVLLKRSSSPQ